MSRTLIKVRFNLARGINYMKFKVEYPDGRKEYYSPTDYQLVMSNTTLKNHKKVAQKIFEGGEKVVCAWVLCEVIEIRTENFITDSSKKIKYNPRVQPNWILDGKNVDGHKFDRIHNVDYGLYLTNNKS